MGVALSLPLIRTVSPGNHVSYVARCSGVCAMRAVRSAGNICLGQNSAPWSIGHSDSSDSVTAVLKASVACEMTRRRRRMVVQTNNFHWRCVRRIVCRPLHDTCWRLTPPPGLAKDTQHEFRADHDRVVFEEEEPGHKLARRNVPAEVPGVGRVLHRCDFVHEGRWVYGHRASHKDDQVL